MTGNVNAADSEAYTYDAASNRTALVHPDGQWLGMVYDSMGRATYMHSNWTAGIAYAYRNAAGDIGTSARNSVPVNYTYDSAQRLTAISHETVGSCCVRWLFTRNPAGGIAGETRENFGPGQGQADSYGWAGHYATARAYTTNGLNQYSAAGSTALSYDANGNLTASGSSAYVYDIENRLVGAPGSTVLSYDPLGRLWQVSNTSTTTRFLYDGDAMVAEYNAAGTLTRRHAHWPGADVPMVSYAGTDLSQPTQLLPDARGSIVTLANNSGALTGINTYDEYGIPGAANSGRFQYTGQIWLAELGMYYYKARIYSPTLGRFMQVDPIGYNDQFNLYAYVGNDPINRTDPTGLAAFDERRYRGNDQKLARALNRVLSARGHASVSVRINGDTYNISRTGNTVSLTTTYQGYAVNMSGTFVPIRGSEGFRLANAQISGDVRASGNPGTITVYGAFKSGTNVPRISYVAQNAFTLRPTGLFSVLRHTVGRDVPMSVIGD